jgi:hypothetical protein
VESHRTPHQLAAGRATSGCLNFTRETNTIAAGIMYVMCLKYGKTALR